MPKSIEYTPEDARAWLTENPWDWDIPEEVWAGSVGFAFFVLDRRSAELGGEIRQRFEELMTTVARHRLEFIRRFWRS